MLPFISANNTMYQCSIIGQGRRPWCEGPGYTNENHEDWTRATDKDHADYDECDNDQAKR